MTSTYAHIQKGKLESILKRQPAKHHDTGKSQNFKLRQKHNQKLLHKKLYISLHVEHME